MERTGPEAEELFERLTGLPAGALPRPVGPRDVSDLVRVALRQDVTAALQMAHRLQQSGVAVSDLLESWVLRAARALGAMWEADRCGFADVTVATGVLQRVVRAVEGDMSAAQPWALSRAPRSILLAAVPGSDHTLGLSIVATFFRAALWDVLEAPRTRHDELLDLAGRPGFDLIGLSAGASRDLPALTQTVQALRAGALTQELPILLGGPGLLTDEALALELDIDGVALDARDALTQAEALVSARVAARDRSWSSAGD